MRLMVHRLDPILFMQFNPFEFQMNAHRVQDWLRYLNQDPTSFADMQTSGIVSVKCEGFDLLITFTSKDKLETWVADRWIYEMATVGN